MFNMRFIKKIVKEKIIDWGVFNDKIVRLGREVELREARDGFPKEKTDTPNCVIGNAIPKSGTYLLNSIFRTLNMWVDTRIHFLDNHFFEFHDGRDTTSTNFPGHLSVPLLRTGQLAAGHLHYKAELGEYLREHTHVKHVFQFRDPRDIFVSYARFFTYSEAARHWERSRKESDFFRTFFSNDDDRLTYAIMHLMQRENWDEYVPWMTAPNTLCLRFEDLYRELLALESEGFGPVLTGLLDYLSCPSTQLDPMIFSENVLGKGFTSSGEKNKIGQYKHYFKPEHERLLDNDVFHKILDMFGYN